MANTPKYISSIALLALAAAPFAAAQTIEELLQANESGRYYWYASLVEVDADGGRVTLEAPIARHADTTRMGDLAPGTGTVLTWSGRQWGSSVLGLGASPVYESELTLPVEYEGMEQDGEYLRFSVAAPAEAVANLSDLSSGNWVAGVSPRNAAASDGSEVIVSIEPYNATTS